MQTNDFSCEKADKCEGVTSNCRVFIFSENLLCHPSKRFMYCYEWKHKLGMVFDKDLGVFIIPAWKPILMERAKQCVTR